MATITANGCRQVAAFTTERVLSTSDGATTYCERWVLRSDGKLLKRICWTDAGDEPRYYGRNGVKTTRLDHSSGLHICGQLKDPANITRDWLEGFLVRKGYAIVREG